MKKLGKVVLWIIGIVVVLELAGLVVVHFSRRVRLGTVLTLRLEGDIPEQPGRHPVLEVLAGYPLTVTEIIEGLDRARSDPRISGIDIRVGETTMNMAKLQEVREKIREFNRTGKFSVAFMEFATDRSYYLASSCRTVFLLPTSVLFVRGMMASTAFYRGTLEKLGIYPDLLHIGEYKNATNIYTEKKYTTAHREATQALLLDWYQEFLRGVAEARNLDLREVESVIGRGPLTSRQALEAHLVDGLTYADQEHDWALEKNGGRDNSLSLREYLRRTERDRGPRVAVIYATGVIVPGRSSDDPFAGNLMGSDTIAEQFRRAREDKSIRAVVLRVDSPGGTAFASEVIRREAELTRRAKPVVVSMSDVAASGGYWIAASADKIVAEPGTITGSIGVITGKFNLRGLFDKFGVSLDYVPTAENSTLDWPFQNFTPAQREIIQRLMRDTYGEFLRLVAEGRHMKVEAVDQIAQGRVWTGERAKRLGLVDELGGLHTAIALAKQLAKIPATEPVTLVTLPPPKSLWESISGMTEGADPTLAGPVAPLKTALARLESLVGQPVWALLPTVPSVR